MKTIYIVVSGTRGSLWRFWISALSAAGYNIDILDAAVMESASVEVQSGDTILLDGMLPDLSMCISRLCALYPETRLIVASETNAYSVQYEVLEHTGSSYVSGPMPPAMFVEAMQRNALQPMGKAIPA